LLLIAAGLGIVGILVYSFMPQPVEVETALVGRGDLSVTVDREGKTRVRERFIVSAPLPGQLWRIDLDPGDAVQADKTVLAVIEPREPALLDDRERAQAEAKVRAAEAGKDRAKASLDRAREMVALSITELVRARQLHNQRGISETEFEQARNKERTAAADLRVAEFAVNIADFELEMARSALIRTLPASPGDADARRIRINSPITGQVLRLFEESAKSISSGDKLIEVGNPAELECEIDVLSVDAVKIQPGAKVLLEHWGGERPLLGRVRRVEPSGFTKVSALGVEEQRVNVIVDFVDPFEQRKTLGDAYRVEARIVIWEASNVLLAPSGALFRHQDGWAVFVVQDNRAVLRPLKVGQNNGQYAQILEGLAENERIVLYPSDKVSDGAAIVVR
jgi:HlyD family secretion protein